MHNLKLLRRHFPQHAHRVSIGLVVCSVGAIVIGIGVLLF
jgi:hypothetical protein